MWWGRAAGGASARALLVVLRARTLEAGWAAEAASSGSSWRTVGVDIAGAAPMPALGGAGPVEPEAAQADGIRGALIAAFAALQALLADPRRGPGQAVRREMTVLLAGPAVTALGLPWSEALCDRDARAYLQAELAARGVDVQADDLLAIDESPPPGRPRTVVCVPAWLAQEVEKLAGASNCDVAGLQSLNAVAAAWATRQPSATPQRGPGPASAAAALIGSGALQFHTGGTLGEVLADSAPGGTIALQAAALWRRAQVRMPALAAAGAGVRLLSLDEPPPAHADKAATSPQGLPPDGDRGSSGIAWLPWPAGADARAALDRSLLQEAIARPTVQAWPGAIRRRAAAPGPALALVCLAAAAALALGAWRQEAAARALALQAAAPAPPAPAAPPPSAAELAELRAVNAAVRQLNVSVPALLRALQPPRDLAIALVKLDLAGAGAQAGGGGSAIRLSLEAATARDMTQYVGFLGGRKGVSEVQLVRHEAEPAQHRSPYKFDVELAWQR